MLSDPSLIKCRKLGNRKEAGYFWEDDLLLSTGFIGYMGDVLLWLLTTRLSVSCYPHPG